jgi:hypothetical protein
MVDYSIEGGIVTLKSVGDHTLADVMAALARALSDPHLPTGAALLIDVCKSDHVPTQEQIIGFAGFLKATHELIPGRCAVLACDVLRRGLAFELSGWAAARGVQVRVFKLDEPEPAREWLLSGASEDCGPRSASGA